MLSTDFFIDRSIKIHGYKYDYSLVDYKKSKEKVEIICPVHGVFTQRPNAHLNGAGCVECGIIEAKLKTRLGKPAFVDKAKKVHGDKYQYSLVDYAGSKKKVKIICPDHGIFEQTPNAHLRGIHCPKCGFAIRNAKNRLSKEEFVSRCIDVHGHKYDYSLVEYSGNRTKVKIGCPKHGIFTQKPNSHLTGCGCPRCSVENTVAWNKLSTEAFIIKSKETHGDRYDYLSVVYTDSSAKVTILCKKHGIFYQTATIHMSGSGCPKCAVDCKADKFRSTVEDFICKAKIIHNNKYNYSKVFYVNALTKVEIECPKHGAFFQQPGAHLYGTGCPSCLESHGERRIAYFLGLHGIVYEREKKFDGCRNVRPLFFDFYIPKLNVCIEYDGAQHLYPCNYFGGVPALEKVRKSDAIKNGFCQDNGIRLVRIPSERNVLKIDSILEKELIQPSMQV